MEPLRLREWRAFCRTVEINHTRDISADDAERDRIMMAVHAYTRALSDSAPILTDDGEPLSRIDIIARIIDPVSFETVRQGGQMDDAEWRCKRARDKAFHIATLFTHRPDADTCGTNDQSRGEQNPSASPKEVSPTQKDPHHGR